MSARRGREGREAAARGGRTCSLGSAPRLSSQPRRPPRGARAEDALQLRDASGAARPGGRAAASPGPAASASLGWDMRLENIRGDGSPPSKPGKRRSKKPIKRAKLAFSNPPEPSWPFSPGQAWVKLAADPFDNPPSSSLLVSPTSSPVPPAPCCCPAAPALPAAAAPSITPSRRPFL